MDVLTALQAHSADDAAAFVGWLMLQAGDVEVDKGFEPHLLRFVSLVGLTADLTAEQRQHKVDVFFAQRPLPPDLLEAFQAMAQAIQAETAASATDNARAASAILGTATSNVPVGHAGAVAGTMRGGLAGLVQARTKKTP